MPNAPETRRDDHGSSRNSEAQQTVNLFQFPAVYSLGDLLREELATLTNRGARSPYSHASMLAVVAAIRVHASLPRTLRALWNGDTWERCSEAHAARTGVPLPATPPTRDQVRAFRDRISEPETLKALKTRFRRVAVGQARALGNLLPGVEPDWTRPDERHTIYGDGVILAPYSGVSSRTHPDTGEVVLFGSRARRPENARIQRFFTDLSEDEKVAVGVNFVAVHTWTTAGRVVLATSATLGAEQWAALALIDRLAGLTDDGIHTVLWDRAIRGWCVDYLMGTHRIQVIGEAVGRRAKNLKHKPIAEEGHGDEERAAANAQLDPLQVHENPMKRRTQRLAAEYQSAHDKAVATILRQDILTELYYSGAPQPVGTTLRRGRQGVEVTFSKSFQVPPAEHQTEAGPCRHELIVDDGGLFTVGQHPEDGYLVKTAYLPCTSSKPVQGPDGRWGTVNTYQVPCESGSFTHNRAWTPDGTRHTQDTPKTKRRATDQVGHELRSLNQHDKTFPAVFSRRNDAEAYNSWMQSTTPHPGRAASEGLARQELDFLTAAILNNSETWARRPRT